MSKIKLIGEPLQLRYKDEIDLESELQISNGYVISGNIIAKELFQITDKFIGVANKHRVHIYKIENYRLELIIDAEFKELTKLFKGLFEKYGKDLIVDINDTKNTQVFVTSNNYTIEIVSYIILDYWKAICWKNFIAVWDNDDNRLKVIHCWNMKIGLYGTKICTLILKSSDGKYSVMRYNKTKIYNEPNLKPLKGHHYIVTNDNSYTTSMLYVSSHNGTYKFWDILGNYLGEKQEYNNENELDFSS